MFGYDNACCFLLVFVSLAAVAHGNHQEPTFVTAGSNAVMIPVGRPKTTLKTDKGKLPKYLIVGGSNADRKYYKSIATVQVKVGDMWYHVCGASLLTNTKVLIAAHCLKYEGQFPYRVGLGWYNLDEDETNPFSRTVDVVNSVIHPGYDDSEGVSPHDIAVLTLAQHVDYSKYIKPAKLPSSRAEFTYQYCYVAGWGFTNEEYPSILQEIETYTIDMTTCLKFWRGFVGKKILAKFNVCTLAWPRLVSACTGDSGGPLLCGPHLVGVVSWGLTECNACFPDVFVKVAKYVKWIKKHMQD